MEEEEEGGLLAKKIHSAKGKKTLHLCEMEIKTKFNWFKMLKSVHKSKPNKIYGGKLTCRGRDGRRNVEESSQRRVTLRFHVTVEPYIRRDVGSETTRR